MAKDPHPVDVHIGQRVRLARTMNEMSQEKLGEALGLTFQQIQKYEKGANRMGGSRLWAVAQALDVSPAYFFEGLEDNGDPETETARAARAVSTFAATREGARLVSGFQLIGSNDTRRAFLALIENLARESVDDD